MELKGASIVAVPAALNRQTIARLGADLAAASADPGTHVLVLAGGEAEFCRGLDLGEATDGAGPALEQFAACLRTIRLGQKPVIALVRGAAVAGGVGLAAACDGVLATCDASFTLTELIFGLAPAIILPYLAERLPQQKLRWMALRAQALSAPEALQFGLADHVCAPEDAPKLLRQWVRQLRRAQPVAVALWKRLTADSAAASSQEGVQLTLERLHDPMVRRGIREFMESGQLPSAQEGDD